MIYKKIINTGLHPAASGKHDTLLNAVIALAIILAHFGKAERVIDDFTSEPVANSTFWIEFLMSYGKAISGFCLAALIALFWRNSRRKSRPWTGPAAWLLFLNSFMQIKLILFSDIYFVVSGLFVIFVTFISFIVYYSNIYNNNRIYINTANIFITIGFSVSSINIYYWIFFPESAINFSSRLHGLSVNPQHLAMVMVLTTPSILYAIATSERHSIKRWLLMSGFVMVTWVVFLTQSRMGLAAIVFSSVAFYGFSRPSGRVYGTMGLICFFFLVMYFFVSIGWLFQESAQSALERGDTRTENWTSALGQFWSSPIFGVVPEKDIGRYSFVESSFISASVAGGIIGLMAVSAILWKIIKMLLQKSGGEVDRREIAFWKSSILTVCIIGVFEAGFLGLFSSHTMMIYLIMIGSHNVLAKKRMQPIGLKMMRHRSLEPDLRKTLIS
jgi:hypothetical protein